MKRNKIFGLVLIISALMLQVGYAQVVSVPIEREIVNIDGYRVQFKEVKYEADKYVDIKPPIINEGNNVTINVNNMYPGARFTVSCNLENQGTKALKITKVEILPKVKTNENFILSGYDDSNGLSDTIQGGAQGYTDYLTKKYLNQQIGINKVIPITIKMAMNEEITDQKTQSAGFIVKVGFNDTDGETGPGGNGSGSGGSSSSSSSNSTTIINPVVPVPTPRATVEDENMPGGQATIKDDKVPGGQATIKDDKVPGGQTTIKDDKVPGGGLLPKTGGLAAVIVYGLGIMLLIAGVLIYTRKQKAKNEK